jgi:hypothetical protein
VKGLFFYIFLAFVIFQAPVRINGQSPVNDSILLKSLVFREKFQLFTDRNIYAAGEKIFFRAFSLNPLLKKSGWSKILYIDIINEPNTSIAQGKYLLNERGTWGYIEIPETVPSGFYYLRAYTKWMCNFLPAGYFHNLITIINPDKIELQTGRNQPVPDADSLQNFSEIQRKIIQCNTNKDVYTKREKATISLSLSEKKAFSPDGYCLTVVKTGILDTGMYGIRSSANKNINHPEFVNYFPETKGLSLSGSIVTNNRKTPVTYAKVHLLLLGNNPDYFNFLTNRDGKFRFLLPPCTGTQDIYITVETDNNHPAEILIDDNFSTDFVQFPKKSFVISAEQKEHILEIMFNAQIDKIFSQPLTNTEPAKKEDSSFLCFYGSPLITLKTDDYIKLPTLEEFFFELIPTVILKKEKGIRYFTMVGNHNDLAIYKPLILLDKVPVYDIETILPVSPEKIDHIDIINAIYIRGDLCFGGIINIFSREGDRAGIDFPGNSFFFNFKAFEPQQEIKFPDYNSIHQSERIPDFRNCLFWIPDIKINAGEEIKFDFYTSDSQGKYMVVVRGITTDGVILEGQCNFVVK